MSQVSCRGDIPFIYNDPYEQPLRELPTSLRRMWYCVFGSLRCLQEKGLEIGYWSEQKNWEWWRNAKYWHLIYCSRYETGSFTPRTVYALFLKNKAPAVYINSNGPIQLVDMGNRNTKNSNRRPFLTVCLTTHTTFFGPPGGHKDNPLCWGFIGLGRESIRSIPLFKKHSCPTG